MYKSCDAYVPAFIAAVVNSVGMHYHAVLSVNCLITCICCFSSLLTSFQKLSFIFFSHLNKKFTSKKCCVRFIAFTGRICFYYCIFALKMYHFDFIYSLRMLLSHTHIFWEVLKGSLCEKGVVCSLLQECFWVHLPQL